MSRPVRLPPHAPGMAIGLYGGTFDPPHAGHLLVVATALRRLRLDRVWWIVTPANPIKGHRPRASKRDRLAAVASFARHPRMAVADLETGTAPAYTADTLRLLRRRCPGVRFVWIMGADGLAGLHRWRRWREIVRSVPIAVVDRPGWTHRAVHARAASAFARARRPAMAASGLADTKAPAWTMLHGRRSTLSSTGIRARQS